MNLYEFLNKPADEKFEYFMNYLSPSNRTPDYYVNWKKVVEKTERFELELNTLNYLIGKKDIYTLAKKLFIDQPNLLRAIPSLIASRDQDLTILNIEEGEKFQYEQLDFNNININKIDDYMMFLDESGLLKFISGSSKQNLVDFVYGVETGLDSNARKNRSGNMMEQILEKHVNHIIRNTNHKISMIEQATSSHIKSLWDKDVPIDVERRRFDLAIYNETLDKLFVCETNYYGGGGSKLKTVAGEFQYLNSLISDKDDIEFIWLTDGQGWKTARHPLNVAFKDIDYIFNLHMLENGFLKELIH